MDTPPQMWHPFAQNLRLDKTLFESEDLSIYKSGKLVRMWVFRKWTQSHLRLVKKYTVSCLHIHSSDFPAKNSAEFLCELPPLRAMHLVVDRPMNLSVISKLVHLEHLGLAGKLLLGSNDATTPIIDLRSLKKLKSAFIQLCRITESVLGCSALESLDMWDEAREYLGAGRTEIDLSGLPALRKLRITQWPKLKSLDLTAQEKLERLELYALPKLKLQGVLLHPKAALKSLGFGGCGDYRIDWNRIGEKLEELELQGPLRFPFEDVLKARNLRRIFTSGVKTFPRLKFLGELKKLNSFSYFNPPPGPKFSEEDYAVVRKINECGDQNYKKLKRRSRK